MIELKRIFPECCADTILVEKILQRGRPAHYHGINNVGEALCNYGGGEFIIGLIDTDKFKRKDPKIGLFTALVTDELHDQKLMHDQKILIRRLPETNKYIIRIHPEFEPWIWDLAAQCSIDPGDPEYGFDTLVKLGEATKTEEAFNNPKLKKFINAVVLQNPPPIQTLRFWLSKVF